MARTKLKAVQIDGDWYEELGRATATAGATNLTVNFTAKKYLRIITIGIPNGGSLTAQVNFNNDLANSYAWRYSDNGAADSTGPTVGGIYPDTGGGNYAIYGILEVINIAAVEKAWMLQVVGNNTAGTANVPARRTMFGKWANTSAQVNRVDFKANLNSFGAGAEIIVLGHD